MDALNLIPEALRGEQWHVVQNVPIFVDHEIEFNENGSWKKVKYSPERIKRLCKRVQEACKRGRFPMIQRDHVPVDPKTGEVDSRKIEHFGYDVNHRTKTIGGRTYLFCDQLFFKDKAKEAEQYPYRSIEVDLKSDTYCPTALLKHTPRLDIGVMLPGDYRAGQVPTARLGTLAYSLPRRLSVRVGQAGRMVYSLHGGINMAGEFDPKALQTALIGLNEALTPIIEGKVKYSARDAGGTDQDDRLSAIEQRLDALENSQGTTVTYSRRQQLEKLANDYNLDIDAEMADFGDVSDEEFGRHVSTIKRSYSRRASGGNRVEPLVIPGDPTFGGQINADDIAIAGRVAQKLRRSSGENINVGQVAMEIKQGKHKDLL